MPKLPKHPKTISGPTGTSGESLYPTGSEFGTSNPSTQPQQQQTTSTNPMSIIPQSDPSISTQSGQSGVPTSNPPFLTPIPSNLDPQLGGSSSCPILPILTSSFGASGTGESMARPGFEPTPVQNQALQGTHLNHWTTDPNQRGQVPLTLRSGRQLATNRTSSNRARSCPKPGPHGTLMKFDDDDAPKMIMSQGVPKTQMEAISGVIPMMTMMPTHAHHDIIKSEAHSGHIPGSLASHSRHIPGSLESHSGQIPTSLESNSKDLPITEAPQMSDFGQFLTSPTPQLTSPPTFDMQSWTSFLQHSMFNWPNPMQFFHHTAVPFVGGGYMRPQTPTLVPTTVLTEGTARSQRTNEAIQVEVNGEILPMMLTHNGNDKKWPRQMRCMMKKVVQPKKCQTLKIASRCVKGGVEVHRAI